MNNMNVKSINLNKYCQRLLKCNKSNNKAQMAKII